MRKLTLTVLCEGCGYVEELDGVTADEIVEKGVLALPLPDDDWISEDGRDFCPDCAAGESLEEINFWLNVEYRNEIRQGLR